MRLRILLLTLSFFLLGAAAAPVVAQSVISGPKLKPKPKPKPRPAKPRPAKVDAFKQMMDKGKDQYSKKDYKAALATFQAALAKFPAKKSEVQPWINNCNMRLEEMAREEAARRERERLEAEQRAREEEENRQQIINRLIANMVYVEGGTFTMGATKEQGRDVYHWEKPKHKVTLSGFYICKYEVTQAEWKAVMGTNPSSDIGDDLPVDNVSWDDCQAFIRKLNDLTGKNFRLPTEAQWEYAARGGNKSQGYKYSGSNNIDDVAWYCENSHATIHPVGMKRANELGLHDMSGNVREWCQDYYGSYRREAQTNPAGPSTSTVKVLLGGGRYYMTTHRVYRGGACRYLAECCRVSYRSSTEPSKRYDREYLGLRLAL